MKVTVVEFNCYKLVDIAKEHGWTNKSLSLAIGRKHHYITNCVYSGKINLTYLEAISEMLETPIDVFLDLRPPEPKKVVKKPKLKSKPQPEAEPDPDQEPRIVLDDHGTEALMEAIVRQAKTDWLTAYHDEVTGFKPKYRRKERLTTNQIERELKHFWFRRVLIGSITDNQYAVEKMISIWRQEAEEKYDNRRR